MAKICFVTGKKVLFGNNVSHSKRKTRRKFLPNLHKMRFWVPVKNAFMTFNVSSKGLRIINKFGIDRVFLEKNKYNKRIKKSYGKKK